MTLLYKSKNITDITDTSFSDPSSAEPAQQDADTSFKAQFVRGQILHKDGKAFRIIYVTPDNVVLVRMDINKLDIHAETTGGLCLAIENGIVTQETPTITVFDPRQVPQKYLEAYDIRKQIVSCITDKYGPSFLGLTYKSKKNLLDELAVEFGYTRKTINNIIRKYLQEGMTEASLLDARWLQTGKIRSSMYDLAKSDANLSDLPKKKAFFLQCFEEALKIKISGGKDVTYKQAYDAMIITHFSEYRCDEFGEVKIYEKPRDEIPSYDQFVRYCHKMMTKEEIDKFTLGEMEQRNNKRLLSGSSEFGVEGCYDCCEMDAWECDFSLVSEDDPNKVVGRAIIYMIKDVATRAIVACSVGFDNNSTKGCLNCLANLNEPKKELLAKYGINMKDDRIWLTGYQPRTLRVDNGSEFISNKLFDIMPRLGITQGIVPPGQGSMKAVIERSFQDIHKELRPYLANNGHITKDHDSKHHEQALLNIRQFTRLVFLYVITYNQKLNAGIGYTVDMAKSAVTDINGKEIRGVPQIPYLAMQYYLPKTMPRMLPQGDEFFKAFLFDNGASLSRDGITLKDYNLHYFPSRDQALLEQMYNLQKRRVSLKVKIDPRNVDQIYYVSDNKLKIAVLNESYGVQKDYKGMTFDQYKNLMKMKNEANAQAYAEARSAELTSMVEYAGTVWEAKKDNPTYNNPENIRKNRFDEQQKVSYGYSLESRFGTSHMQELPEPEIDDRPQFISRAQSEPEEEVTKNMPLDIINEPIDNLMEIMFDDDYE